MYQFRVVKIREVVIWPCNEFWLAKNFFFDHVSTQQWLFSNQTFDRYKVAVDKQWLSKDRWEPKKGLNFIFFLSEKILRRIKIGTFSILFIFICLAESKSWKLIKLKTAGAENEKLIFPGHFSSDHISRFSLEVLNNSRTS